MESSTQPIAVRILVDSLAAGSTTVVDLSHALSASTPMISLPDPLTDAPGWKLSKISRYDKSGPMFYWNAFEGSEHMGTHFDAPVHWITGRDGRDVSQIDGSELIGDVFVVDRTREASEDPDYLLSIVDVEQFIEEHGPLTPGSWLVLRTGWGRRHKDPIAFLNADSEGSHWPGMEAECARYLAEQTQIRGYGVEHIGIDAGMAHTFQPPYPAHHYLLGAGKYGLASLAELHRLPLTGAVLVVAPLRIVSGSGSPARVYALVPETGASRSAENT